MSIKQNVKQTAILLVLIKSYTRKEFDDSGALGFAVDVYKRVHAINKKQKLKLPNDEAIRITVDFVREIAKGKDGVIGTSDDLIDPKTTQQIVDMLSSDLLEDVLRMITDAVKLELSCYTSVFCVTKWCCVR
jgi:chemotaxis signal transduction protein|tara:strand:+ start:68 stop:463 length:396 start_codon:yes stop_codon:yes gene_type:complete